ncbi:hypothetical protein J2T19_002769 [Paenibacillus tundrae]|uniref:Uncharacterized protein n=1 Tax=Paenibacillus tundrae TaxID=528187 RepID=A0ABT9WDG3_9BACL|nr:hypothetical protein [Paenibacillus tundrae]
MTHNIEQFVTLHPVKKEELADFQQASNAAFLKGLKDS